MDSPDSFVQAPSDPTTPAPTGGIEGAAAQAAADVTAPPQATPAAPPQADSAPAQKPSVWRAVVQGALHGLAGSAGAKSFGAGLAGGASGELEQQQLQKNNALRQQQQQNENDKTKVDVAHTQALIAQVQRATMNMPANHQQAIIEGRADQTEALRRIGAMNPVGTEDTSPDHHVALQQVTALTQQNPGKLYSAEPVKSADGKIAFQAMQVSDAPLSEDIPLLGLDGTKIGMIPKGTPGTQAAKLQAAAIAQGVSDLSTKNQSKAPTTKTVNVPGKGNRIMAWNPDSQKFDRDMGAAALTPKDEINTAALGPDALDFHPKLPVTGAQGYQKTYSAFKKNLDDLSQTDQSYQQFADMVKKIDSGQTFTGADSIVGLFNAIGISAEPLKGKGFRINNLTVAEHAGARGIRQAIEQKFGKLETGEIITPQQLKDYAGIAAAVRENKYVSLVNQMHNVGLNADAALPTGNGQKADPSTARIFLRLVGWNSGQATPQQKQAAQAAMQKKGWNF